SSFWKPDWATARETWSDWWSGNGLAVAITAPRDQPLGDFPAPPPPVDPWQRWVDPQWRATAQLYHLSRTYYGGAAFPQFDTSLGPGSLGLLLGAGGHPADATVWYTPCMQDYAGPTLTVDRDNPWWHHHVAMLDTAI